MPVIVIFMLAFVALLIGIILIVSGFGAAGWKEKLVTSAFWLVAASLGGWLIFWSFQPKIKIEEVTVPIELITYKNGMQEQVAFVNGVKVNILERFKVIAPPTSKLRVVFYNPTSVGIYDMLNPDNYAEYTIVDK